LDVSDFTVSYALDHSKEGLKSPPPQRKASNKTKDADLEGVREHINAFPVIESHYCRSTTKRKYLEQGLSVNMMYRLYGERCHEKGIGPVSLFVYRNVFNTEFNLGFYIPGNDQCDTCTIYKAIVKTSPTT
jgi:hypothetical protein